MFEMSLRCITRDCQRKKEEREGEGRRKKRTIKIFFKKKLTLLTQAGKRH